MTEKERIIIDGADVSECLFYQINFEEDYDVKIKHFCSNWHNSCESSNNSNCYFKQLARKIQESEQKEKELKELKRQYKLSCLDCEYKNTKADVDRYRKALEEIEEYCNNVLSFTATRTTESDILDIINEAKGEENE